MKITYPSVNFSIKQNFKSILKGKIIDLISEIRNQECRHNIVVF